MCHLRRHGHLRADLRNTGGWGPRRGGVSAGGGCAQGEAPRLGDLSEARSSLPDVTTKARPRRPRVLGARGPRGADAHTHLRDPPVEGVCPTVSSRPREPAVAPAKGHAGGGGGGSRVCACATRVRARWGRHARASAALAHRDLPLCAVRSLVPAQGPRRGPQEAPPGGVVAPGSRLAVRGHRVPAAHQVAPFRSPPFGPRRRTGPQLCHQRSLVGRTAWTRASASVPLRTASRGGSASRPGFEGPARRPPLTRLTHWSLRTRSLGKRPRAGS